MALFTVFTLRFDTNGHECPAHYFGSISCRLLVGCWSSTRENTEPRPFGKNGVRLTKHYSQCAPCSPGRASLYTGMYQMNHRVVANGTPLDRRFDNVALLARRAGYKPTLFGYTDQSVDPRDTTGADDWRLNTFEGILPGFDCELFIPEPHDLWINHLNENGFDVPMNAKQALLTEPDRPAEFGQSAFLTDHLLGWLKKQDGPWFAHASYLRPHPPYSAAGKWSKAYDPADVELPIAPGNDLPST